MLDIESWNRKSQFLFFRGYDNPFFNICTSVDVTRLLQWVKSRGRSFFIGYLYLSLRAANDLPEFRYRIRGDGVLVHDRIHAGSTILNPDETFSFCYFDYFSTFEQFETNAHRVLQEHAAAGGGLEARDDRDDLIHCSVIPWLGFTSFSHARRFGRRDSVPKIVFGKAEKAGRQIRMPVSVEVHHALMDGIHVAKFVERFQGYLSDPEGSLR